MMSTEIMLLYPSDQRHSIWWRATNSQLYSIHTQGLFCDKEMIWSVLIVQLKLCLLYTSVHKEVSAYRVPIVLRAIWKIFRHLKMMNMNFYYFSINFNKRNPIPLINVAHLKVHHSAFFISGDCRETITTVSH